MIIVSDTVALNIHFEGLLLMVLSIMIKHTQIKTIQYKSYTLFKMNWSKYITYVIIYEQIGWKTLVWVPLRLGNNLVSNLHYTVKTENVELVGHTEELQLLMPCGIWENVVHGACSIFFTITSSVRRCVRHCKKRWNQCFHLWGTSCWYITRG